MNDSWCAGLATRIVPGYPLDTTEELKKKADLLLFFIKRCPDYG